MRSRFVGRSLVAVATLVVGCGDASTPVTDDAGQNGSDATGADASNVTDAAPTDGAAPPTDAGDPCTPIPNASFATLGIQGAPSNRPAAQHGDINLLLRTWKPAPAAAQRGLVQINGPTDTKAPKLEGLFDPLRVPKFSEVYQAQGWDWGCNCASATMTDPEVTLAGLAVQPGEIVHAPASGYDIGQGYAVLVLYATSETITLKYTPEDDVVHGYTIHIAGVCADPKLLSTYAAADKAGRTKLPALMPKQAFGRARGKEIVVAIRDTGSWMDPRSQKDWW